MVEFILLRPAQITREILNILNILTPTSKLTIGEAQNILTLQLKNYHLTYVGYINGTPVCLGSIVILTKLGNNGGRSCLIEDVAVNPSWQGKGIGRKLVDFLVEKAITYKVYKIILNCKSELLPFYYKCGFNQVGLYMRMNVD